MHRRVVIALILIILAVVLLFFTKIQPAKNQAQNPLSQVLPTTPQPLDPLAIAAMRAKDCPGSDLKIGETLENGSNYHQYIASYISDGFKIYGLLTVPIGDPSTQVKPQNGWPAIIFNHGYIPPTQYRTTERYAAYVDGFARNGYIVFKPDFRGNGSSEGQPEGAYYSPAYATDALNALVSVKKLPEVDPNRIGMWGHSMGGNITLRSLVVRPNDIKAAVIWGGVVGTYDDLINNWQRRVTYQPPPGELALRNRRRAEIIKKYGTPSTNPKFWNSVDPNSYLADITTPVGIHAGLSDEEVPWDFSRGLYQRLKEKGKKVEFFTYEGADHNISAPAFNIAMQRSIEFFDKYLK